MRSAAGFDENVWCLLFNNLEPSEATKFWNLEKYVSGGKCIHVNFARRQKNS